MSAEVAEVRTQLDQLQTDLSSAAGRIDSLIGDQDQKFTDAQEARRQEFNESLLTAQGRLRAIEQEMEKRRDQAVARIEEVESEVSETAAAFAGRTTALSHAEESDKQATRAFRWSVATILLALVAAGVPILAGVLNSDQSSESVAGKIAMGLIIAGVAGYAGSIARHHRERAAVARRLEMELNAFAPFVAPLDRPDRNDIRSTIVWRFFGPPEATDQDVDSDPRPGPRLVEILKSRRSKRADAQPEPSEEE